MPVEDYIPAPAPQDTTAIPLYLQRELTRVSTFLSSAGIAPLYHEEPRLPQEGELVLADGTDWNPTGGGYGLYVYLSAAWVKIV